MGTKICALCGDEQPEKNFHPARCTPGGRSPDCRRCCRIALANGVERAFVLRSNLLISMRRSARQRRHPPVTISREDFFAWLDANGFDALYHRYVETGCDKWARPSVDRLNNAKSYEFGNMRLVTWQENFDAADAMRRQPNANRVLQYEADA